MVLLSASRPRTLRAEPNLNPARAPLSTVVKHCRKSNPGSPRVRLQPCHRKSDEVARSKLPNRHYRPEPSVDTSSEHAPIFED